MTGRMRTSRVGIDLIKSFEGFRPTAARLPDGRWTIGYGHVRSAREGVTIVERDAEDLLRFDLRTVEAAILDLTHAPLTQNQFDALASLVFNISPGQFKDSEILRRFNAGEHLAAASGFDAWRKARVNGRLIVVDALVRRRAAEKALFLEPPEGRPAAPTPMITPEFDASAFVLGGSRDGAAEVTAALDGKLAEVKVNARAEEAGPFGVKEISAAVGRIARGDFEDRQGGGAAAAKASVAQTEIPARPSDSVAERIARILAREEARVQSENGAAAKAQEDARASSTIANPTVPPPPRIFIDDTEIYEVELPRVEDRRNS